MNLKTLVILALVVFGVYKGVKYAGAAVDGAMDAGREGSAGVADEGVRIDLVLDYKQKKAVARDQFDALNAGMLSLKGSVTNKGPALRSVVVRVRWKDKKLGAVEKSELVDLGAFDKDQTRQFDEVFANTLAERSPDGKWLKYEFESDISLESVIPR